MPTCAGRKEVFSEQRQAGGEHTWGGSAGRSSTCKGPEEAVLGEVEEQRGWGSVSRGWILSDRVGHGRALAPSKMGAARPRI